MGKGLSLTLGAALASAASFALAQSPPGSFAAGPGYVYPEIEFAVKRDTNIALAPDAARESDTISYLRPAIRFDALRDVQRYDVGYRGEYARYRSSKKDDYDNHEVFADGVWTLSARHHLKLNGQYLDKVDQRGYLQVSTPTPNEYRQPILGGFYAYGAEDAAGRLELQAGRYTKTYLNNRQQTEPLDHSRTELGGTFLLRVLPKSLGTFGARQYHYDYPNAGLTKNSRDTYLYAGLRWEVTSVTSGQITVGHQTKKFESTGAGGPSDYSGLGWEGGLTWRPLFYSTLDFLTQKRPQESTGFGEFVLNQTHQVVWTHIWGSRITTFLTAEYWTDSYTGTNREDATSLVGLRLLYTTRRWLKFGAEYVNSMRSSNDDNFDYQRNQFMLLAHLTL